MTDAFEQACKKNEHEEISKMLSGTRPGVHLIINCSINKNGIIVDSWPTNLKLKKVRQHLKNVW